MIRKGNRIIQVLAVHARCTECGWVAQPVLLAYNQVTHSDALWCQSCFSQASETGQLSPRKEVAA